MTLSISKIPQLFSISKLRPLLAPLAAIALLVVAMGGKWTRAAVAAPTAPAAAAATGSAAKPAAAMSHAAAGDPDEPPAKKANRKQISGKLNLNTATEEQLMLLPTVGPSKAERIVTWRKKNGGFKRTADLRRVKGFGYKTFKRLEPYLDVQGESTLAAN